MHDVRELVHRSEPDVEVRQSGIRAEVLAVLRGEPRAGARIARLEVARRQHVAEDVDLHGRILR